MKMRSGVRTKVHWKDYLAHTYRQLWGGCWGSWRIWVVSLLPYILGAGMGWLIVPLLVDISPDGGRTTLAIAGAYGALGAYVTNCFIAPRLQKSAVAEEGTFCGSLTLSWNEDGVTTSVGGATCTFSWLALIGITETKKTLFIQADQCEAVVIPLNVFEDANDLAAFKAYAIARIKAK